MLTVLEVAGIFVFALSGAALAVRQRLDIIGATSLALVTALAGGVLRDVVIGDTPPLAFREPRYLVIPLIATFVVVAAPRLPGALHRPVLVFDAAGLGLFTVVGARRAIEAGLGLGATVLIGVISAAGGGIVRDMLVSQVPQVFRPGSRLYVLPATAGALGVAVAAKFDLAPDTVSVVVALAVFVLRMLALRYGWSTSPLGTGRRRRFTRGTGS